jgi:hypothetical protein
MLLPKQGKSGHSTLLTGSDEGKAEICERSSPLAGERLQHPRYSAGRSAPELRVSADPKGVLW